MDVNKLMLRGLLDRTNTTYSLVSMRIQSHVNTHASVMAVFHQLSCSSVVVEEAVI